MPKYADLLKLDQDEKSYAALMRRNYRIANTHEVAKGGYSNLDPNATVQSASVPQLATDTQAAATQGYDTLAPVTAPASVPTTGTEQKQPATEPKTDTASPSTGETEATGYAKYLAQHPELAEADRRAEAEYARALPTYGALAERMAQAGIHGGYSDYLQGVAYAQMQNAKAEIGKQARAGYADYLNGGSSKGLYSYLTGGSYTDADGNTVQGYNLLDMTDEQYNAAKPTIKSILTESGKFTPAQIEEAFAGVERTRGTTVDTNKAQAADLFTRYGNKTATEDEVLTAFGFDPESVEDKPEAIRFAIESAYKDKLIDQPQASATITKNLPMYEEGFDNKSWKETGADIYNSVSTAIDDHAAGIVTDSDLDKVVNDALAKTGVREISYVLSELDRHADLRITLSNGVELRADYNGKANEEVTNALNKEYSNLPLAIYNDTLYYQPYNNGEWCVLKTKVGSKGTTKQGDKYFATIAKIMMLNKKNVEKQPKSNATDKKYTWDIKTGKITYSKK